VYLAGRQRAGKEMNGKSANLNNCLRQLYPGDHPVPAAEIVCVFDADQARPAAPRATGRCLMNTAKRCRHKQAWPEQRLVLGCRGAAACRGPAGGGAAGGRLRRLAAAARRSRGQTSF